MEPNPGDNRLSPVTRPRWQCDSKTVRMVVLPCHIAPGCLQLIKSIEGRIAADRVWENFLGGTHGDIGRNVVVCMVSLVNGTCTSHNEMAYIVGDKQATCEIKGKCCRPVGLVRNPAYDWPDRQRIPF
jgi:hypothetical protein